MNSKNNETTPCQEIPPDEAMLSKVHDAIAKEISLRENIQKAMNKYSSVFGSNEQEALSRAIAKGLDCPYKDVTRIVKELSSTRKIKKFKFQEDVPPYSQPVSPLLVFEELVNVFKERMVFHNYGIADAQAITCALWVMATWCIDSFNFVSYLMITAPDKRCGKTQLMSLLSKLSRRPLDSASISASSIFRVIEKYQPTVLIDEIDSFLHKDPEIIGILNSGIQKDFAYAVRNEKQADGNFEPQGYSTFSFKALSGVKAHKIKGTLTDRCIVIGLRRKLKHEKVIRDRHGHSDMWRDLNKKCARIAVDFANQLQNSKPDIPDELDDRAGDKWDCLFAIADLIDNEARKSGQSPQYGEKARAVAVLLSSIQLDEDSVGAELLANTEEVLSQYGDHACILSADLLTDLNANPEWRWRTFNKGKSLTYSQLADLLKDYEVYPRKLGADMKRRRGYRMVDFKDAFARYQSGEIIHEKPRPNGKSTIPAGNTPNDGISVGERKLSVNRKSNTVPDSCFIEGLEDIPGPDFYPFD